LPQYKTFLKSQHMLISYSHKFLFVHIYKTAGNSVARALEPHAYRPGSWRLSNLPTWLTIPHQNLLTKKPPKHASAADLRALIPQSIFKELFKFTFVRNPWDWQVSLYHYILEHPADRMHERVKAMGSFEAYIHWRATDYRTQTSQISDESGKCLVDFVGRVETIDEDFVEICRRIGIRSNLGHQNKSSHRPYREYYSDETREIVVKIYAEDIAKFGYSF